MAQLLLKHLPSKIPKRFVLKKSKTCKISWQILLTFPKKAQFFFNFDKMFFWYWKELFRAATLNSYYNYKTIVIFSPSLPLEGSKHFQILEFLEFKGPRGSPEAAYTLSGSAFLTVTACKFRKPLESKYHLPIVSNGWNNKIVC